MIAHFATDINVGRNRESPKNMHNFHFGLSENIHTITSSDILHTNSDEISIGFEKYNFKFLGSGKYAQFAF